MTIKIFRNKYLKSNEFFQINIILYFPRTQECPNVSELNMCPTRLYLPFWSIRGYWLTSEI